MLARDRCTVKWLALRMGCPERPLSLCMISGRVPQHFLAYRNGYTASKFCLIFGWFSMVFALIFGRFLIHFSVDFCWSISSLPLSFIFSFSCSSLQSNALLVTSLFKVTLLFSLTLFAFFVSVCLSLFLSLSPPPLNVLVLCLSLSQEGLGGDIPMQSPPLRRDSPLGPT